MSRPRAVILPAVLFILLLVGLLGAMFAFRVNADLATTRAVALRLDTRLAAEAGVERMKLLLADDRLDMDAWYNDPEHLHRIVVWSSDGDSTVWGTNNEDLDEFATTYRFSIVADDPTDDEQFIRFGITDESSKLNLNTATKRQLGLLVTAALGEASEIDPDEIVDAILDWRDSDSDIRSELSDTEREYYRTLDRPYRIKNGPFDTVDELLLVKGMTNEIYYGEDFDRNGLLTPNEDDGDETFPMDNQDNVLNRGLYPYLTVLSYDVNTANDRSPRIYLKGPEADVREKLMEVFEDDAGIVDFIIAKVKADAPAASGGSGGRGGRSPAPQQGQPGGTGPDNTGNGGQVPVGDGELTPLDSADKGGGGFGGKDGTRQQRRQADPGDPEGTPQDVDEGAGEGDPEAGEGDPAPSETDHGQSASQPMRSPAGLLRGYVVDGVEHPSPIGPEQLATLLDRTTLVAPQQRQIPGLINVNTAPRLVLRCLDGLSDEQIDRIIEVRASLDSEAKRTPAWLLTEEVVDLDTFERIADRITARGQQFTIEALGYADHVGMVTRLQVVVDMVGPIAQTIYYRDVSYLGARFPIREEDLENIRVR